MANLKKTNPQLWMKLANPPSFLTFKEGAAFEKNVQALLSVAPKYDDPWAYVAAGSERAIAQAKARAAQAGYVTQIKAGSAMGEVSSMRIKAIGTATSRVIGAFTDVGIQFLDPAPAQSMGQFVSYLKVRTLFERGNINEIEWDEINGLMTHGQYPEADRRLKEILSKRSAEER